ncbi:MAG: hypothetical protein ABI297_04510 [Ginsengibacter sp.]
MKKYFPFFLLLSLIFCFSCKKTIENISQSTFEKYFDKYVIGSNFKVTLAKDGTTDFTSEYEDYNFILLKTDFHHGPLKATNGTSENTGTWSTNDDYSKLIITLPDSIAKFKFLNRSWRFTKKEVPTLQLAPWGSDDPITLYMTRQ